MLNDHNVVSFVIQITQQDSYMKHEGILESVTKCSMNDDGVGSSIVFFRR